MHALASLRRNAPSPPPVAAQQAGASGAPPRLPDPNVILAQLERAIAATEYSYASAQLASLADRFQETRSVHQGVSSHGKSDNATASHPGARANGEPRRSIDGAAYVVGVQVEDERPGMTEGEKSSGTADSSLPVRPPGKPKHLRRASGSGSANDADAIATTDGVEVIHRKRSSSKAASAVENGKIPDSEGGGHDAGVADQAYRAGNSALAEGDPSEALTHLRLSLAKCPPDKPSAVAKIQRLITVAQDQLESQRRGDLSATRKAKQMQDGGYLDKLPMTVLQVGDVEAADHAYRAGVAALENGEPAKALEYLDKAARACPPDRPAAVAKIQLLVGQAHFELRLDS